MSTAIKRVIRPWLATTIALGFLFAVGTAGAQERDHGGPGRGGDRGGAAHQHFDNHFQHNQYYPSRGAVVHEVPHGGVGVDFRGGHYFYAGGVWYRPYGGGFVVIGPPFGAFVPFLPPFYTTLWWGGLPYYYANDTYYTYAGPDQGYEVVAPPPNASEISTAAPAAADIVIYPKNGQSEAQQSQDRYECHRWAVGQTGFDPTQPGGGAAADQGPGGRASYQRAMNACLEGRGYSVR